MLLNSKEILNLRLVRAEQDLNPTPSPQQKEITQGVSSRICRRRLLVCSKQVTGML